MFLFLIGIVLVSGCTDTQEGIQMVENGDFVKVNYVGELEDGTVVKAHIYALKGINPAESGTGVS